MESRSLFELGCRDRPLHPGLRPTTTRITQAPGDGLSLLLRLALSGQTLHTGEVGSRLPTRLDSWVVATIERSHNPRTRARFAAFAGIRIGSGRFTACSRERSRCGLLSMICITTW